MFHIYETLINIFENNEYLFIIYHFLMITVYHIVY